ncbi:MAG: peptide deformylase [Gammaproteobacteria bacterium]
MAILNILNYPDERLRIEASPVENVDGRIARLVDDMFETMYAAPWIGLAATQVNVHEQIIVMDVAENKSQPLTFINPEIIARDGIQAIDEGCLSVPGIYEPVERARHIQVRAIDKQGNPFEMEAEDLLAVCIQHEMDHLRGKLFVDYLSQLKRQRIRKKLQKQQKVAI